MVQRNDAAAAIAELENGADANAPSVDGTTALHWAVHNDNADLVERLIDAGANVNASNDYGATPLTEAAVVGNAEVVELLVAGGADVNAPGKDGQTPLMVLARGSSVAAARVLLEHGADVNAREAWRDQTALIWAAAQNQPAMVKLLLEHGADPDARSEPPTWDRQISGEKRRLFRPFGALTALLYAAREGCVECARALVEGGADIDLSGYRGITPVMMALDNFHFDLAAYLVEAGASLNVWDWWGRSPLYVAIDMNTLTAGGRYDLPSTDETTGVQVAAQMLAKGANPNLQIKLLPPLRERGKDRGCDSMLSTGATPLIRAAKTFDVRVAEAARRERRAARSAERERHYAVDGGRRVRLGRVRHPRLRHSAICDGRRREEGHRSVAGVARRRQRYRRSDHRRRPRQRARSNRPLRRRVLGLERRRQLSREQRRAHRRRGWRRSNAVDAAMGRAGGHDRGSTIVTFEDTATLLEKLCSEQTDCDVAALKPQS